MLTRFLAWAKNNKLVVFLGLIIIYLLWQQNSLPFLSRYGYESDNWGLGSAEMNSKTVTDTISDPYLPPSGTDFPPTLSDGERMQVIDTSLSIVSADVATVANQIETQVVSVGGYLVSSSLDRASESPSATLTVRVPVTSLAETLTYIRTLGEKVTYEVTNASDVTDEYTDLDAHLSILNKSKTRYEEIRDKAVTVSELVEVQRELTNIQTQIDNLIGRQNYLSQNAALSRITVYLASDETVLPYAPEGGFKPATIFRLAVRSLITHAYDLGEALIWIGVYGVVWLPAGLIGLVLYRRFRTKQSLQK